MFSRGGDNNRAASAAGAAAAAAAATDSLTRGLSILTWRRVATFLDVDELYCMACSCRDFAEACDHDAVWHPLYLLLREYAESGTELPHHTLREVSVMFPRTESMSPAARKAHDEGHFLIDPPYGLPSPPFAYNFTIPYDFRGVSSSGAFGGVRAAMQQARRAGRAGLPAPQRNQNELEDACEKEWCTDSEEKQKRTALIRQRIDQHMRKTVNVFGCSSFREFRDLAIFIGAPRLIQHLELERDLELRLKGWGNQRCDSQQQNRDPYVRSLELLLRAVLTERNVRRVEAIRGRDMALAVVQAERDKEIRAKEEAREGRNLRATASRRQQQQGPAGARFRQPSAAVSGSNNNDDNDSNDDDDDDKKKKEQQETSEDPRDRRVCYLDRKIPPLRATKHFWLWLDTLERSSFDEQLQACDVLAPAMGQNWKYKTTQALGLSLASVLCLFIQGRVVLPLAQWAWGWVNAFPLLQTKWFDDFFARGFKSCEIFRHFPLQQHLLRGGKGNALGSSAFLSNSSSSSTGSAASATGAVSDAMSNFSNTSVAVDAEKAFSGFLVLGIEVVRWILGRIFGLAVGAFFFFKNIAVEVIFSVFVYASEELQFVLGKLQLLARDPMSTIPEMLFSLPVPSRLALALLAVGVVGSVVFAGNLPSLRGVPRRFHRDYLRHKLLHNVASGCAGRITDWWILFAADTVLNMYRGFLETPLWVAYRIVTGAGGDLTHGAATVFNALKAGEAFVLSKLPPETVSTVTDFGAKSLSYVPDWVFSATSVFAGTSLSGLGGDVVAGYITAAADKLIGSSQQEGVSTFAGVCLFGSLAIAALRPWYTAGVFGKFRSLNGRTNLFDEPHSNFLAGIVALRKSWRPERILGSTVQNMEAHSRAEKQQRWQDQQQQSSVLDSDDPQIEVQLGEISLAAANNFDGVRVAKKYPSTTPGSLIRLAGGRSTGAAVFPRVGGLLGVRQNRGTSIFDAPMSTWFASGKFTADPGMSTKLCLALAMHSALNAALCIMRWRCYTAGSSVYRVLSTEIAVRVGVSLLEFIVESVIAPLEVAPPPAAAAATVQE